MLLALLQTDASEALAGHALVYSARERAVLRIGGDALGARPILRLSGSAWVPLPGSEMPARSLPAVAADAEGNLLLHGGAVAREAADGSTEFVVQGDTWRWDGKAWTQVATDGPAPRDHHAMVFDAKAKTFVLFGGSDADPSGRTTLYGDTWAWRGSRWELVAETGPSPRAHHAMVHDPARGRTLLVGGGDDRTWSWDGKRWESVAAGAPAGRTLPRLVWDPRSARVLLFGGDEGERSPSDTWAWDGTSWSVATTSGPPGRSVHGLAFDDARGVTVLFGGATRMEVLGDLWERSSEGWKRLGP